MTCSDGVGSDVPRRPRRRSTNTLEPDLVDLEVLAHSGTQLVFADLVGLRFHLGGEGALRERQHEVAGPRRRRPVDRAQVAIAALDGQRVKQRVVATVPVFTLRSTPWSFLTVFTLRSTPWSFLMSPALTLGVQARPGADARRPGRRTARWRTKAPSRVDLPRLGVVGQIESQFGSALTEVSDQHIGTDVN